MAKAVANPMQIEYTKAKAEKITFTSNQLKLIAIAAMVFDHCMVVFIPHDLAIYEVLRMPGRLTAPIMCFLIAEGYYHTSNLWRYMKRLFVMAVISHVPFALCFGYNVWAFWQATDVLWALLLGLIALTIYHRKGLLPARLPGGLELHRGADGAAVWNFPRGKEPADRLPHRRHHPVRAAGPGLRHLGFGKARHPLF